MPLVSVIVPVYKAERWLHRCVDSILAQTMEDFELLLIDDGSPDRSGEICDEYAAKDSRVRVFHKENGGVSSARNLGLDNAQGEWISFVDADDWVEVEYLAGLTENLDADFITGGMRDTQGNICVAENKLYFNSNIKEFIDQHNGDFFLRAACGKLLRREIIEKNRIRFDENVRFGEDTLFNKQVLLYSDSVRVIDNVAYVYYFPVGVDGILKYKLTLNEIEHISQKLLDRNEQLIEKFLCKDFWHDVHYLLLMYDLSEVLLNGDNRVYNLYKQGFLDKKYIGFCADNTHSPIVKAFVEIKQLYAKGCFREAKQKYIVFENYSRNTPWFIKFEYKSFYLWYILIKCRMWFVFDILMKLYCKLK